MTMTTSSQHQFGKWNHKFKIRTLFSNNFVFWTIKTLTNQIANFLWKSTTMIIRSVISMFQRFLCCIKTWLESVIWPILYFLLMIILFTLKLIKDLLIYKLRWILNFALTMKNLLIRKVRKWQNSRDNQKQNFWKIAQINFASKTLISFKFT